MKLPCVPPLLILCLCAFSPLVHAEKPEVPDWAQPGSATHVQVAPPVDFHRPSKTFATKIGVFEGQTDVGSAVVPGNARYDAKTKSYTVESAGYNIWYTRDEFRYLWKKLSGDLSLATDITFPNPSGYGDRKVVLVIRQDLDDDSKEAMAALHGAGLIHLAQRPEKGASIKEDFRIEGPRQAASASEKKEMRVKPKRLGIEKHGDEIALFVSLDGEPMHQVGSVIKLPFAEPFYVGLGFCSHLPDTSDAAVLSNLVFENSAGKVH